MLPAPRNARSLNRAQLHRCRSASSAPCTATQDLARAQLALRFQRNSGGRTNGGQMSSTIFAACFSSSTKSSGVIFSLAISSTRPGSSHGIFGWWHTGLVPLSSAAGAVTSSVVGDRGAGGATGMGSGPETDGVITP